MARAWSASLFCLALTACSSEAETHVVYARGFDHRPMKVSVIGALQNGLLNADTWTDLAPLLSGVLKSSTCDDFYSKELDASQPALASAIDHYTKTSGVSDALLQKIAPAAAGDILMLITLGAHTEKSTPPTATQAAALPGRRGQRTRQAPQRGGSTTITENSFELSASFYSVRLQQLVAQMDMTYVGDTLDDAIRLFALDLQKQFPETTCAGWNREAHIDPNAIESMVETEPDRD